MMRDLVRIKCYVVLQWSQTTNHVGSLALPASKRQISGYLPTFACKTILTRILSCRLFLVALLGASFYLTRFLACPVGCPCFRFRGSVGLIIGLAMGRAEFKGIDVTISFSGWSLGKVLTIFLGWMTAKEGFQVFSSSG